MRTKKRSVVIIIILFFLIQNMVVKAQNLLTNSGFEQSVAKDRVVDWNLIPGWNCSDDSAGISNKEFYSPVDGNYFAFQRGKGSEIYQETDHEISAGKTYRLKLWARSINPAGVTARTDVMISLKGGSKSIVSTTENVDAPQLKGAAAKYHNDDGANIWIDGKYRHQFSDEHMYQPISDDPIKDPWKIVKNSNYGAIDSLGWAVGLINLGDNKYIYGTLYRDIPGNFYSSLTMTKALSSDGVEYEWSKPVTILDHDGSEFPWVLDAHCYYDESTGRLWMSWGGGTCYVSELDPADGRLIDNPESTEFDTHPDEMHTPVAQWPETRPGWCGDKWSVCWMEGPALYKHNGYWYYFASYGNLSKDYTIRYGRGKKPTGPFYDKQGQDMMKFDRERNEYGNTILLGEESDQLVPGHPHIWEEDGKFYMGYDFRKEPQKDRDYMGIRRLYWVNDWPTIYKPVTVSFNADDYPELIGKKLTASFKNIGESNSELAVDHVSLEIISNKK